MTIRSEITEYGFHFGAAEVIRLTNHERTGNVWILVKTPKGELEIRVTRTGFMRLTTTGKMKICEEPSA